MDVLFINPAESKRIYQDLSEEYSAIEPSTWALLLAQSCRAAGYSVGILDVLAEKLTDDQTLERINSLHPRLLCFVVYGQNPNSGTVNMIGTLRLARAIKEAKITIPLAVVGSHVQALPHEVLDKERDIDLIFTNEGVYALRNLLKEDLNDLTKLSHIRGIGFRKNGKPFLTLPERIVPQERMDLDLPGYAWDLLPYNKKPLDLYRAHFWHADYKHENRSPFAAIYTSLGCNFRCSFCMINMINRNDNEEVGVAGNYAGMRFWSPEFIIKEFDKLVEMGVKTLRISDEMFLLNPRYYLPLCDLLIERGYGEILSMWAYSRVDTAKKPENLRKIRQAGIKWLALGIESADQKVRYEVTKGKFQDIDIKEVVKRVHDADIEIMANYLAGLPGDTQETMQNTLDLSKELCTLGWNMYAAMALPGSQLYKDAKEAGSELPDDYSGYSFHSYDTKPLPTDSLTAAEILEFRDKAWKEYHTYEPFLDKIEIKYGRAARQNILDMSEIALKRKILED